MQKFGVSFFFFKEMNTFIQRGFIKLIKSDNKDIAIWLLIMKHYYCFYFCNTVPWWERERERKPQTYKC